MPFFALYDVLGSFKDIHQVVLRLAESLDDGQLRWRPDGYSTSIGFHLWHVARESDYLRAAILQFYPQIGSDFGDPREIWISENLAEKWGFPAGLHETVGTGLSDEAAANLPIPPKAELLQYLRSSYQMIEEFIEQFDGKYASFEGLDEEMAKKIQNIRLNLMVFLSHDCRHLGMMETLKGLQTGFGSATEQRQPGTPAA